MSLQDLGNLGEFLGAVGVIVSLIYLSLQIRHNTRAVNASSNHSMDQSFANFLTLLIENPGAAAVFSKGVGSLEALDDTERNTTRCSRFSSRTSRTRFCTSSRA